jgi:hypothetical protein
MDLLQYEFNTSPDGSINGMLRTLVKELRYNTSQIRIEEFKQRLPALKDIERRLQVLDADIGQPTRNYIEEIMDELNEESDLETKLIDDLNRAPIAITNSILGKDINIDEYQYETGKSEHYHWLKFSGYADQRPVDANLLIVREVFRAITYKHNYVFIDLS